MSVGAPTVRTMADAVVARGLVKRYGDVTAVAGVDLEVAGRARSAAEAMHVVVVGTVLVDPVLVALRRLAQEAESAARA